MKCKNCGVKFANTSATNVFCSDRCRVDGLPVGVCEYCGVEFRKTTYNRKYCSQDCNNAWWNENMKGSPLIRVGSEIRCPTCDVLFVKKSGGHRYCSIRCSKNAMRHGMNREEYLSFISRGCDVCGGHTDLVVDHNHNCCPGKTSCGECIRGVLCGACNKAEGFLRSSPELAMRLANYLKKGSGAKEDGNTA